MQHANKGDAKALDGTGLRVAIVQARFNEGITNALASACRAELSALGGVVQIPFEAFKDVEGMAETGPGGRLRRQGGTFAAATQEDHHGVLAHPGFEFLHEAGIAIHRGAGRPGDVHARRDLPDERALFGGPHVHEHGATALDQRPRVGRSNPAGVDQAVVPGALAGL